MSYSLVSSMVGVHYDERDASNDLNFQNRKKSPKTFEKLDGTDTQHKGRYETSNLLEVLVGLEIGPKVAD